MGSQNVSRSDMQLILKSLRKGWLVDRDKAAEIATSMREILDSPNASNRERLRAGEILHELRVHSLWPA